jgi:hypothetical protein
MRLFLNMRIRGRATGVAPITDYGQVRKKWAVIGNSLRARVAQRAVTFLSRPAREGKEKRRKGGGNRGGRRIGTSRSTDDDESTRAASSAV